jgi:putative phosphoesterase
MLVGVVSDTHDNIALTRRAAKLLLERGAELVLHLGDIVAPFTLRVFAEVGVRKLVAVYGNNCGEKLGLLRVAQTLGYSIHDPPYILVLGKRRLLLMHGQGPPDEAKAVAESVALSGRYDAVLYGHTHTPDYRVVDGTVLLNPGEVCGCLTGRSTVALLDLETMKAEILEVASVEDEARVGPR